MARQEVAVSGDDAICAYLTTVTGITASSCRLKSQGVEVLLWCSVVCFFRQRFAPSHLISANLSLPRFRKTAA